jgi:peptidoglycan/xylan/chitin deacetylase (PgdA/CDA1 family)
MRLFRPFFFAQCLYPDAIFRIKTTRKELWLTFDDGPDPVSTPGLLNILGKHDVKALFFCNGSAAEKYPDLIEQIKAQGHLIGNHGYSHLNGWKTPVSEYLIDVERASVVTSSVFFRPSYGRLKISQYLKLRKKYKIIFWDLMPYDFDMSFGTDKSMKILIEKLRPGSVIVLHDRPESTLNKDLEYFIRTALEQGYAFILPDFI